VFDGPSPEPALGDVLDVDARDLAAPRAGGVDGHHVQAQRALDDGKTTLFCRSLFVLLSSSNEKPMGSIREEARQVFGGPMSLKAVAFDLGHTLMDERRDEHVPIGTRPVHLMPGVSDVLPHLTLQLAVWANTRVATEADVRGWLDRAGLGRFFQWVITSVDAGVRKPAPEFFEYALARCGLAKDEVLFVGNQLNTDIAGAEAFGIRTAWLSDPAYRSPDDAPCDACPTHTIRTLYDLPALVQQLRTS
jgi:beta-phosphoglucomutase-like phosphatase (HAD superfamily)